MLYSIEVSENFLECYLVEAVNEGYSSFTELKLMAEAQGITAPLDEIKITEIINSNTTPKNVLIASGKAPKNGRDAELKFKVDVSAKPRFVPEVECEKVDYKNAMKRATVGVGDLVAVLVKATKGVSGIDVLGRPVPAEDGKEMVLHFGQGIEQENNLYFATTNGIPRLIKGILTVEESLRIEGGVNMASGNIKSPYSVVVYGNVEEGFEIVSEGDVQIYGAFFGSKIYAKGHVNISGGITGKGASLVVAEGRIETLFVSNGNLEAKEAIMITKDCLHSRVFSLENVECNGAIVGGEVKAKKLVSSKRFGSELSGKTKVMVGVNYELEKLYDYKTHLMNEAQKILEFYKSAIAEASLAREYKEKLENDISSLDKMIDLVQKVDLRVKNLEAEGGQILEPKIRVYEMIYADVQFRAPHCYLEFKEEVSGAAIYKAQLEKSSFELVR